MSRLNGVFEDLKTQWDNAVNSFKVQENNFRAAVKDLTTNKQRYYRAGLQQQYDSVMSKATVINNTIESALNTIRSVYAFLREQFGLGVLPAIPFAALAVAAGAIGAFLLAYKTLNTALQEYEIRQLPAELQPQARQNLLNAPTLASDIKQTVFGLGVLALLVFVLPKMFKK